MDIQNSDMELSLWGQLTQNAPGLHGATGDGLKLNVQSLVTSLGKTDLLGCTLPKEYKMCYIR